MADPKAEKSLQARVPEILSIASALDDLSKNRVKEIRKKTATLHKVTLSFMITIWETYIEDIQKEAVEFIVKETKDPKLLSWDVLLPISERLKDHKDKRSIWKISGDSWKKEYQKLANDLVEGFNTPRPDNVDILFKKSLGLKNISSEWSWKGASNSSVKSKLNKWITRRGEFIHQLKTKDNVRWHQLLDLMSITNRCSRITANRTRTYLHGIYGKYPWDLVNYRSTK